MTTPLKALPPSLSATVVIVKNATNGLYVLLLQRNQSLNVLGGYWVFPGGVLDDNDLGMDIEDRLLQAAVRETFEETSIQIKTSSLIKVSRWLTPESIPRRFDTHFYITSTDKENVVVDAEEIVSYQWLSPRKAIALHEQGDLPLMPPTLVTLKGLLHCTNTERALAQFNKKSWINYLPKACVKEDQVIMLYQDDVGYEEACPSQPGLKHRCLWLKDHWHYINEIAENAV